MVSLKTMRLDDLKKFDRTTKTALAILAAISLFLLAPYLGLRLGGSSHEASSPRLNESVKRPIPNRESPVKKPAPPSKGGKLAEIEELLK